MNIGEKLRAHIDGHLGTTPSGLVIEERLGIRVATFDDMPSPGLVTSVTIGVSGHELKQVVSQRTLRQELMTCVDRKYGDLPWHEVLLSVAKDVVTHHAALMLGEVLGPGGLLFPETQKCTATALLCAPPAFFDDDFSEIELDDRTSMVIVELMPITSEEASWVKRHGWSAFFDRVNSGKIDIMNLSR